MKKITFLAISLLSLTACSKLDEEPKSYLTTDQFYQNEEQATAAVNGIYRKLYESGQSLYNSLFQIGVEMASDDYIAAPEVARPTSLAP